ncbi:MAG: hypothetical protein GX221_05320 [Candidatus Riflebacteria bacterium]|nr:hypothetical protein [Candidatus Riflebacteria bacterium]
MSENNPNFDISVYLSQMQTDEEIVLANLAFDPPMIGRQLIENHFTEDDFQGSHANKVLLSAMLETFEESGNITLADLTAKLLSKKSGKKTLLDIAGGEERINGLMISPFSKDGVRQEEDIEETLERIRARNVRHSARRHLLHYSESMLSEEKDHLEILNDCIRKLREVLLKGSHTYISTIKRNFNAMEEMVADRRLANKHYLGLKTNFPLLMDNLSGFQKEYYLITAGAGMGKSTFATQLAWDLVTLNPYLNVIFFTLDLNRFDVLTKITAQAGKVPIDYVKNPFSVRPDLEDQRLKAIEAVKKVDDRLTIVDESTGRLSIDDIKRQTKRIRLERGGEVAVIIDPIFKIQHKNQHAITFNDSSNFLSSELKSLSAVEGVTVIATAGLPKAVSNRRPVKEDLAEIMGLLYDPYAVFFLYCDYLNDFETPFLEWEWGKEDSFMIPITEAFVAKNKMGHTNASIFFRYYEAYSKFEECAPQEVENYAAMVENLAKYKEYKDLRKNDPAGDSDYIRKEEF